MGISRNHFGNHLYKLTDEQAAEIKIKWESTRHLPQGHPDKPTYHSLMNEYEVGRNCLFKLVHGESYEWIVIGKNGDGEWVRLQ